MSAWSSRNSGRLRYCSSATRRWAKARCMHTCIYVSDDKAFAEHYSVHLHNALQSYLTSRSLPRWKRDRPNNARVRAYRDASACVWCLRVIVKPSIIEVVDPSARIRGFYDCTSTTWAYKSAFIHSLRASVFFFDKYTYVNAYMCMWVDSRPASRSFTAWIVRLLCLTCSRMPFSWLLNISFFRPDTRASCKLISDWRIKWRQEGASFLTYTNVRNFVDKCGSHTASLL